MNTITEEKIITTSIDREVYELVYEKNILCPGKVDDIVFEFKDNGKPLKFKFIFRNEGEKYTTNVLDDTKENIPKETGVNLLYFLNKWDANSYVEISKLVDYSEYKIKFRNQSSENLNHRLFYFSVWRKVNNEK